MLRLWDLSIRSRQMRKRILRQCLRIAQEKNTPDSHPEWGNYHHFSFVIQNNKIIEYGFNRPGRPLDGFGYPESGKIHSENDAYRKARGILESQKPFDIINIRLSKSGDLRMSKPCSCCNSFLSVVGCRNVYFSTDSGFAKLV